MEKTKDNVSMHVKPVIDATINTLETMCELKFTHGKPAWYDRDHKIDAVSIITTIEFTSELLCLSLSLLFPKQTYLSIISSMLGEEFTELDESITDGAAEIMNMIYGQAKTALTNQNISVSMAIPKVIWGEEVSIHYFGNLKKALLPFKKDNMTFYLNIAFSND